MLDLQAIRDAGTGSYHDRGKLGVEIRTAINDYIRSHNIPGKTTPKKTIIHVPNLTLNLPGKENSRMLVACHGGDLKISRYRVPSWECSFNTIKTINIENGLIIFNGVAAFKI